MLYQQALFQDQSINSSEVDVKSMSNEDIRKEFEISARTSIARRSVSAPLAQFINQHSKLIKGSCINYAKGRDEQSLDTMAIKKISGHCSEYDFNYCPDLDITRCSFNFVYCGYCTNVLPILPRGIVWRNLAKLTRYEDGICVVASRSDKDRGIKGIPFEDGVRTQRLNTFQKGYKQEELLREAKEHFRYAIEIAPKGAYRMVICSHNPIV